MKVSFDPAKRQANLAKHGLDLAEAGRVLQGPCLNLADDREAYGEERVLSLGLPRGMVVCVWTDRGEEEARVISLRKATANEQEDYFRTIYG